MKKKRLDGLRLDAVRIRVLVPAEVAQVVGGYATHTSPTLYCSAASVCVCPTMIRC